MIASSNCTIVIPAYNEAKILHIVLKKALKFSRECIVVDDGSTDQTFKKASSLGAKVIRHNRNLGKGAALRTGLLEALKNHRNGKPEFIVTLDADNQHKVNEIPLFLEEMRKTSADICVGYRGKIRGVGNRMPIIRQISNILTSGFCNFAFGLNIRDIQTGFRVFKRSPLKILLSFPPKSNRFDWETEILLNAWSVRMKIVEVPITMVYGSEQENSKIKNLEDTIRWIWVVLKHLLDPKFYNRRRKSSLAYRVNQIASKNS